MLVQDIMRRDVVTVGPKRSLGEVARLLQPRGIRHLPVVDDDRLVGIISDRDIKGAMLSASAGRSAAEAQSLLDRLIAADVMSRAAVTIEPTMPVEEAALIMVTKKISSLPVTEGERLIGIVTDTDVLRLFSRALGVTEPSSRIDVTLGDWPDAVSRVVGIVEDAGVGISSIMTLESPMTRRREAVIRVRTINPGPVIKALETSGYCVRGSWRG